MNDTDSQRMHCMEVWGGNQAVERHFTTPGLGVWVYSCPFGHASGGGDVYYVSSCASGRITRMLLADVSGHGEMVSGMAVELRELMRRNVNYIKQSRFVRAMNQQFAAFGDNGGFATALVTTFFAPTQCLTVCNAGHPAPMVFRQKTSEWTELKAETIQTANVTDTPLGIVAEAEYRQRDVRLNTGDMVLTFSDAVTESLDRDVAQLGQSGVLQLVRELDVREPSEVIPAVVERITSIAPENLTQDDATLLLFQATGTRSSLKDNLLAPFRLFGSVADETKFDDAR